MGATAQRWQEEAEPRTTPIVVAGVPFLADPSGVLFHEGERALLVADLHFEKGSSLARRGMMLPPYDTAATLAALGHVVARLAPKVVIALGDSFHDAAGSDRLSATDRKALLDLQHGRDWLWLAGNHDPLPHATLPGEVHDAWRLGPVSLRHAPSEAAGTGEIAGHLHPVARVIGGGGVTRRRCFVSDGLRCIMPAFGAYAGGLNILHHAFRPLWATPPRRIHALGRDRLYAIPLANCVADG